LLRELARFVAATGLKIEWPDSPRERQEMFKSSSKASAGRSGQVNLA
jgi:hypothetical protein